MCEICGLTIFWGGHIILFRYGHVVSRWKCVSLHELPALLVPDPLRGGARPDAQEEEQEQEQEECQAVTTCTF